MQEVLEFTYSADTDSILMRVSVVKPSEHKNEDGTPVDAMVRQLGVPEPQARFAVSELPITHQVAFRALLADLIPAVEARHAALAVDPVELANRAAKLAHEEHEMARRKKAHDEEMAALDSDLAAKRAEIEALAK